MCTYVILGGDKLEGIWNRYTSDSTPVHLEKGGWLIWQMVEHQQKEEFSDGPHSSSLWDWVDYSALGMDIFTDKYIATYIIFINKA